MNAAVDTHRVSWQNATLRDTPQLPDLDPQLVRRGRGVVRDDPPEAAWSRASSSCGGGSSDRGAVRAAAACGAGIGGGGNGGGGGSKPEADATRGPSGTEAQAGNRRDQTQAPGVAAASKPADMEQERLDQGGEAHGAAAAARVDAGTDRVAPAGKDISLTAATAAAEAGPGAAAGGAAAATSAGEAQEVADADDVELEDSLTAAPESPSQVCVKLTQRYSRIKAASSQLPHCFGPSCIGRSKAEVQDASHATLTAVV